MAKKTVKTQSSRKKKNTAKKTTRTASNKKKLKRGTSKKNIAPLQSARETSLMDQGMTQAKKHPVRTAIIGAGVLALLARLLFWRKKK